MSVASAYRRFAAGLLSFVVLSLASCGGSDAPPASTDTVPASITLSAPGQVAARGLGGDAIANESLSRGGGMR